MQAGTLISAVIAPATGQPASQKSGVAGVGSFTQALMAVLGGSAAGAASATTPGVAGTGQGSATTGNTAGENPGDGQDAGLGQIVNPATEIAPSGAPGLEVAGAAAGAAGLEVAGAAAEAGQATARDHANETALAVAKGLALSGQAPAGDTGDAPAAREAPVQSLGSLLASGAANSDGAIPAATGEAALAAGNSPAILVQGVDGPSSEAADGPDRLGVALEVPNSDKSAVVAAQSAIRISALNEAPGNMADAAATTAKGASRDAAARIPSIGDSAANGSGDRPPMPQTANPQAAAAASETEFTLQPGSSASEPAIQGNAAANGHTSASVGESANTSGQPARPANPVFVNTQVAVHITRAAAEGLDRIIIQLQPESLGKVDVKLEIGNDGRLTAVILAERTDTLDMLQRDARGLERALQEAGLKTDSGSLSFHLRGHGGGTSEFAQHMNNSEADNGDTGDRLAGEEIDESELAGGSNYARNGLLDIHV